MWDKDDEKLKYLLDLVIETYIEKGEPIGSKFLFSLESMNYAPSTLRKYLNLLEKDEFLYQPYNSAGRIPTIKGFSTYIDELLGANTEEEDIELNIEITRNSLRLLVELIGAFVDGAVVGFLKNDEYYFLGIGNLMQGNFWGEYETLRYLVDFIENKKIIEILNQKEIRKYQVYYTFITDHDTTISSLHTKIMINSTPAIISILGPIRINYKKNLKILKNFLKNHKKFI